LIEPGPAVLRGACGYYDDGGKLFYAGRAGTGMSVVPLGKVAGRLKPLAVDKTPLSLASPRKSRFGATLSLSKVHWVKPELVAVVAFLTWTSDGLLRHIVFHGLRDDNKASTVRRGA
jgi:ATP-dependent DNA ligase